MSNFDGYLKKYGKDIVDFVEGKVKRTGKKDH
jgi:hypothetical protein